MRLLRAAMIFAVLMSLYASVDLSALPTDSGQQPAANVVGRRRLVATPRQQRLGACAPGLVAKAGSALDVVVDETHVYYGNGSDLMRAPKNGGEAPATLASAGSMMVALMTMDATHVFFAALHPDTGLGSVTAVPKNGGTPKVIIANVMVPYTIVNDARYVYVASVGTPVGDTFLDDGRIIRAKKDGSEVKTLAAELSFSFAIAVQGENVFFGESDGDLESGSLQRVSIHGGTVSQILKDIFIVNIAADASGLYYSGIDITTFDYGVFRTGLSGGTPSVLVPEVPAESLRIAGGELYYFNEEGLSIEAVPLSGGVPRIVRSGELAFPSLAFDECLVYFTTSNGVERASR